MNDNIGTKPYDLTMVYAISDDNPEFFEKLLLVFSETISTDTKAIKVAADEGRWKDAGLLAHKLKPSAAHFGITSLKDTINALERQGDATPEKLKLLVVELDEVIGNVLLHLKNEFPLIFNI
jgi:HPt (histidine-containing phosphotransfer) domain-containing protein